MNLAGHLAQFLITDLKRIPSHSEREMDNNLQKHTM